MAEYFGIGHEQHFNLYTKFGNELDSDSSWLAVPWLPLLDRDEWKVIHVVRHPQRVCGSLNVSLFGYETPWREFAKYHGSYDVLSFYKRWMDMILDYGADETIKLEDISGDVINEGIEHDLWPAEELIEHINMFDYECLKN
jgi:hypothetical protein